MMLFSWAPCEQSGPISAQTPSRGSQNCAAPKLSAMRQFCIGAQVAVSLQQTTQIVSGLSVSATYGNYASRNNIKSLESRRNYFTFEADAPDVCATRRVSQHVLTAKATALCPEPRAACENHLQPSVRGAFETMLYTGLRETVTDAGIR